MPSPVIYHGASCGNGPWPAVAAPVVPSASVLRRDWYVPAAEFATVQENTGAEPSAAYKTELKMLYPLNTYDWKIRVASLPPLSLTYGACGVSFGWWFPTNGDPAAATVPTIQVFCMSNTGLGAMQLQVSAVLDVPNVLVAAPGSNLAMNFNMNVINAFTWSGLVNLQDTSGGVPAALTVGRHYQISVWRVDNVAAVEYLHVFAVRGSYQVTP